LKLHNYSLQQGSTDAEKFQNQDTNQEIDIQEIKKNIAREEQKEKEEEKKTRQEIKKVEHSEKIIHRQRKIEYSISGSESLSPKSIEEPFSPSASEYVPSSSANSESECESLIIPMLPKIQWSNHYSENDNEENKTEEKKTISKNEEEKTQKRKKNRKVTTKLESSEQVMDRQMEIKYVVSDESFSPKSIKRFGSLPECRSPPSTKKAHLASSINPQRSKEKKTSPRKPDFCFFCDSDVLNFGRHIRRNHMIELEVVKIFSLPTNSKERKDLITILRKKGNFVKNSQICEKPVRNTTIEGKTFVPCKFCLGFYSSKLLYRHVKTCKLQNGRNTTFSHLTDAQNIMLKNIKVDKEIAEKVFPKMLADKISLEAKTDKLICMFGARYIKCHRERHFINVCSRKMRELAKLLLEIKKHKPAIKSLLDALRPENFDLFVSCVKIIAKYDQENDNYQSPTYAMNISTSLKQCCDIAVLNVLKQKSLGHTAAAAETECSLKALKQLFEDSWRFEISTKAAADLNTHKWNKISILPLAQDLKTFKTFLEAEGQKAFLALQTNNFNEQAYKTLLETVFCRLLLLNRKRVGELQRLPVHVYTSNELNAQNYEEFTEAVTPTEKILLKKFKRVVIRGKRGRGVPVLFSLDLQEHTNKLIELRDNYVKIINPFLFCQANSNNPITGYKVLQKYARKCGARNSEALTSTRLRKHLATLSQLFSMSDNDVEQLATFMGHTQNIHRQVYRLPDDVYQTAKISKLLLLMEKGEAAQFKGKTLDEINIDLDIEVDPCENEENNLEESEADAIQQLTDLAPSTSSQIANKQDSKEKNVKPMQKRKLVPWTDKQKETARLFFTKHIRTKRPPKRHEVEEMCSKHAELFANKTWTQIKVFIQNIYTKKY
jgi:hypothetical protein